MISMDSLINHVRQLGRSGKGPIREVLISAAHATYVRRDEFRQELGSFCAEVHLNRLPRVAIAVLLASRWGPTQLLQTMTC